MLRSNKGFSLFEIITVVLITGLGMTLFSVVFVNNWTAYEDRINHANLMNEANQILDEMSYEARKSKQIDLVQTGTTKTITFFSGLDNTTSVVVMRDDGTVTLTRGGTTKTMTTHLDFAGTEIIRDATVGRNLQINLDLKDFAGTREFHVRTATEVQPRN